MNNLQNNLWKRDVVLFVLLLIFATFSACDSSGPGSGVDPAEDDPTGTPSTIIVTPSEATIEVDSTHQFTAEVKDEQGNTLQDASVTWESDNETIANVDNEGEATGMAEGTADIIASAGSVSSSATLTVEASEESSSPNGSWQPVGEGFNSRVQALGVDPGGNIIAGGSFTKTADGTNVNGIARWNGSSWEPIGTGFNNAINNPVQALVVDGNGDLIAGGRISQPGDSSFTSLDHIARWNGSSWEPVGGGLNRHVETLIVGPDGNLIAGGYFDTVGDFFNYGEPPELNHIARWNGSSWEPIGSGLGGNVTTVYALAVTPKGNLIAGGFFSENGEGQVVNNIARWDGNSWKAIGNGVDGSIYALAAGSNGDIIAVGGYLQGNIEVGFATRWSGSSWIPISQELNGRVSAVIIDDNGQIIIGGYFTETADGKVTDLNNIARWNGSSWEQIGTGFSDFLFSDFTMTLALTIDADGNLIAGGGFTQTADGSVTGLNNIARWNPNPD